MNNCSSLAFTLVKIQIEAVALFLKRQRKLHQNHRLGRQNERLVRSSRPSTPSPKEQLAISDNVSPQINIFSLSSSSAFIPKSNSNLTMQHIPVISSGRHHTKKTS